MATYPVNHPNFPGKSALMKRLTREAMVPLNKEFKSFTTTKRQRTMRSNAVTVRMIPASSSLRSVWASRFLQREFPVAFRGKQASVKLLKVLESGTFA